MKIAALTRYSRIGASSRMRFEQFIPALLGHGIVVEVFPLLRDEYIERLYAGKSKSITSTFFDYLHRLIWFINYRHFDLIWIEKELFPDMPPFLEWLLSKSKVHYIVDYDDSIFHNYDLSHNFWRHLLKNKINYVMKYSALVICGNLYLADRAKKAGAVRVEVIPTVIDIKRYSVKTKVPSDKVVIGWIGSPATIKYLDIVLPALRILAKKFTIQLQIVGADLFESDLDVVCIPWSELDEVLKIQEFDIGIMPLADTPWEQGKCGYKLIQYLACGIPVVASPVGANKAIVQHGFNGYLASETNNWVDALESLIVSKEKRIKYGTQGRNLVEAQFCIEVVSTRLANLIKEVVIQKVGC